MRTLITTPKNVYATRRLKEEAAGIGMELECRDVNDLARSFWQVELSDFQALWVRQANPFYDNVIKLAKQFAAAGKLVVDSTIPEQGITDGKFELTAQLTADGLAVPKTFLFTKNTLAQMGYPVIVKWNYGAKGKHVHLVGNPVELERTLAQYNHKQLILQEYIAADYEYKVITVGFASLPVVVRYVYAKARANLLQAEVLDAAAVPHIVALAEAGARALGRELAKVDLLEKNGTAYLLEVNRQPGLELFEKASGVNVASIFLQYIANKLNREAYNVDREG